MNHDYAGCWVFWLSLLCLFILIGRSSGQKQFLEVPVAVAPSVQGEPIRLLSEEIAAGEAGGTGKAKAVAPTNEPQTLLCTQIGAFQAKASAEQVIQRPMAVNVGADIRARLRCRISLDFGSHSSFASYGQQLSVKLKELQANKIDSFIITEG